MTATKPEREVRQYPASSVNPVLRLIPPLAESSPPLSGDEPYDWPVSGNSEVRERARQWALRHHYLLADGVHACAHGLYLMRCPNIGGPGSCGHDAGFDHTELWVPDPFVDWRYGDGPPESPFLLTQPYEDEVPETLKAYARAHGLTVSTDEHGFRGDGWYGHGTLAIRLTAQSSHTLWPIEEESARILLVQPVAWPEVEEKW